MVEYNSIPSYGLRLSEAVYFLNSILGKDTYTNNIVRNYIKSGVLERTELGKKCCYSREHLIQLILISYMRPVFPEKEIKKIISLGFGTIKKSVYKEEIIKRIYLDIYSTVNSDILKESSLYDNDFTKFMISKGLIEDSIKKIRIFEVIMVLIINISNKRKFIKAEIEKSH